MPITAEQAQTELRRRAAAKELERRRATTVPNALGGIGGITSTPLPPRSPMADFADAKIAEYERMRTEETDIAAKRYVFGKKLEREQFIETFGRGNKITPTGEKVIGTIYDFGQSVKDKLTEIAPTSESRREDVQMAAGMAGGMGPHPIVFSGIAGGGAEAVYQIGQQITGSPEAPQTSIEAAERIGMASGTQALQEGIAQTAIKTLTMGSRIPGQLKETTSYMREKGISPTLFQATGSKGTIGILEGIIEGSFTGGPPMVRHKEGQTTILKTVGDDIVNRFGGLSPTDAGRALTEMTIKRQGVREAASGVLHRKISEEAKGTLLPVGMHIEKAAALLKKIKAEVTTEKLVTKETGILDEFGKPIVKEAVEKTQSPVMPSTRNTELIRILENIVSLPGKPAPVGMPKELGPYLPYEIINDNIKKPLGQIAFEHPMATTGRMFTDETERELRSFYHDIYKVYENPDYGLPSRLLPVLKEANLLTTGIHEDYEKKLVQRVVKEHPEKVVDAIIQKKAPVNIDEILAAAGPEAKPILQGAFIQELFTSKALVRKQGQRKALDGNKLLDYLDLEVGQEVLEKFMDKESLAELRTFGDALRVAGEKPPQFGGEITMKMLQAGSTAGLVGIAIGGGGSTLGKKALGGATLVLGGPKVLGWLFRNKSAIKLFETALISEGGEEEVVRLMTRVVSNPTLQKLQQEDIKDLKERNQKEAEELKKGQIAFPSKPFGNKF